MEGCQVNVWVCCGDAGRVVGLAAISNSCVLVAVSLSCNGTTSMPPTHHLLSCLLCMQIFDTADSYGTGALNGRSEELLGRFIRWVEGKTGDVASLIVAYPLTPTPATTPPPTHTATYPKGVPRFPKGGLQPTRGHKVCRLPLACDAGQHSGCV